MFPKITMVSPVTAATVTTSNGAATAPVSPGPTPQVAVTLPEVKVAKERQKLSAEQLAAGREKGKAGWDAYQAKRKANKLAREAGQQLPHPEIVKDKSAKKAGKSRGTKKKGAKGQWFRNPIHKAFNFYVRQMATEFYGQSTMAGDIAQYASKLAVSLTGLVLVPMDGSPSIVLKHRESGIFITIIQTEPSVMTITTSTSAMPDSLKRDLALL